jgi:hypothetical protein
VRAHRKSNLPHLKLFLPLIFVCCAEFLQMALDPLITPPLEDEASIPEDNVRAAIARFRICVAQLRNRSAKLTKPLRIAVGLLQRTLGNLCKHNPRAQKMGMRGQQGVRVVKQLVAGIDR